MSDFHVLCGVVLCRVRLESPRSINHIRVRSGILTYCSLFANSNYISSVSGVMEEFGVGDVLAVLPITLYSIGFSVGPTFGTAFSEIFGRQYFYKVLLTLSLVFTVVAGAAKNYATLAVGRALAGILAAPSIGIFAGVLNDLWDYKVEPVGSTFVMLYSVFGSFAPLVGPVSGAAIVADTGNWRWTFWLTAILLGLCVVLSLAVPETYAPKILRSINKERSNISLSDSLRVGFGRPLHMLLVEPIMLPTAAYGAIVQGILFAYYVAYPYVLQTQYGFSVYHVGLSFLSLLIGAILVLPIMSLIEKMIYQKAKARAEARGETVAPEERLWCCNIGSVMLPVSLFW
jgi:MFS family permease